MNILHVSAECYPAAKVGGLGDVAGALPKYLNQSGLKARVVMPNYKNRFLEENRWEVVHEGDFPMGGGFYHFKVIRELTGKLGFDLYQVEIPGLPGQEMPYGYANDLERHMAFQIAVLEWINRWEHLPDVVHGHDHHSGLIPFMMDYCYRYRRLRDVPNVFTIHNGNYQGAFGWNRRSLIPSFEDADGGMLEWNHQINPMASAIKCCWKFTTVSGGYMEELRSKAAGLESLIQSEWQKATGILNGIDDAVWDPASDPALDLNFNAGSVEEGKKKNKENLARIFQFNSELPLFAFIGRLVEEKGADLLPESIGRCIEQHGNQVQFLVLGSGMDEIEAGLNRLQDAYPNNVSCYIGYNEKLSHLIYAGADFLLMPSRIEPCGLNQMYAQRYGTLPVVRTTGGLRDTVIDFEEQNGSGIRFEQATSDDLCYAVSRAVSLSANQEKLTAIRQYIMGIDHSWTYAAKEYIRLYEGLRS